MPMTLHYSDLGSTSDWSCPEGNSLQPIGSSTLIYVATRHEYKICAVFLFYLFYLFICFFVVLILILLIFQLKGAIRSAEAGREDLEDRLAEMMNKLREARAQADEAVSTKSFQNPGLVAP